MQYGLRNGTGSHSWYTYKRVRRLVGYRLSFGTTIAPTVLMNEKLNTTTLEDMIESEATGSSEIFELIETLAQSNATVEQMA